jgi:hypothetical protein
VETRPTGRTPHEIAEVAPRRCSNGHDIADPRSAFVGFLPCACSGTGGHRTYRCATCGVTDHYPRHDERLPPTLGSRYDS